MLGATALLCTAASPPPYQILRLGSGLRFAIAGSATRGAPSPAIFWFRGAADLAVLAAPPIPPGYLVVSLDLPCYGEARLPGEPEGLDGWVQRITLEKPFLDMFLQSCVAVLNSLAGEGVIDPRRIAVGGVSRGGFMALHFAAVEARIRRAAAIAPLTDLAVLAEFSSLKDSSRLSDLRLLNKASELAKKSVWMCIGSDDNRVGTRPVLDLASAIVNAGAGTTDFQLRVTPQPGHVAYDGALTDAGLWLVAAAKNSKR